MKDVSGVTNVEIKITSSSIWVNTAEEGCVLRICRITGRILINDDRNETGENYTPSQEECDAAEDARA